MSTQLAELYIRGKLMGVTATELPPEWLEKVQDLMLKAWNCELLRNGKMEFCAALTRTIGCEYLNTEIGLQDAQITFWRTALMVLYHETKRCESCGASHTTTYSKLERCDKRLEYWCDQDHGKTKPITINKMWLEENNWLTDKFTYQLANSEHTNILQKVWDGEVIRARACPRCLRNNKLNLVSKDTECGGTLQIRQTPRPTIASEVSFQCRCGEAWTEEHDGNPIASRCNQCKREVTGQYLKRKKFFQTYLFNYLKQILKENKYPQIKESRNVVSPANEVLAEMITKILTVVKIDSTKMTDGEDIIITIARRSLRILPQTIVLQIAALRKKFEDMGVIVNMKKDKITVSPVYDNDNKTTKMITRSMVKKSFVKFVSLQGPDEENTGFEDYCGFKVNNEAEIRSERVIDEIDSIMAIRKNLPTNARQVLDLIVNTPDEYYKRFNCDRIHKNHVMQYLGKSQTEIDQAFSSIKSQLIHRRSQDLQAE